MSAAAQAAMQWVPDVDALRRDYARDGYVVVRGLIDPSELAPLAEAVDAAVARRKARDTRCLEEMSRYEQSFLQCQYLWEDSPDLRPLTFHQAICAMAGALIEADTVRLWHDQALYKQTAGKPTQAHQDSPYWPIAEDHKTVTAWIPLMDVNRETGCMGYVPGSHLGTRQFVDIFAGDEATAPQIEDQAVFVEAALGDVLFHHGRTMHMALPNRTSATRRAYTAIYFADGCTRSGDRPHPAVDRDGVAEGARICGKATPIVWPRLPGDYPEPGAWPEPTSDRARRALELGIIPDLR